VAIKSSTIKHTYLLALFIGSNDGIRLICNSQGSKVGGEQGLNGGVNRGGWRGVKGRTKGQPISIS